MDRNTIKYWKTEMAEENDILSYLFQFATHQQIIDLQNNLSCGFDREILKQSLFPNKPFFYIIPHSDAKDC